MTAYQGVDFLGYRLVVRKGHLNVHISPKGVERFREEVRRLTRRTAGRSLRVVVSRLDRYVRGSGEYFKRAEVAGVLTGSIAGSRGGCEPIWRCDGATGALALGPRPAVRVSPSGSRLYHLRRNFVRDRAARRAAGPSTLARSRPPGLSRSDPGEERRRERRSETGSGTRAGHLPILMRSGPYGAGGMRGREPVAARLARDGRRRRAADGQP